MSWVAAFIVCGPNAIAAAAAVACAPAPEKKDKSAPLPPETYDEHRESSRYAQLSRDQEFDHKQEGGY